MNRGKAKPVSLRCLCVMTVLVISTVTLADRTLIDIIVAQNVKSELQPKLDRLASDLRNDGYTARISPWPAGKSPEDVWNHLKDSYENDNLQGALLIGHIPMHRRDTSTVEVRNTATDAVYWSMTSYESMEPLHIWVSRFYAPSSSGYGDEVTLITNALDANHDYRTGRSRLSHTAWTYLGDGIQNPTYNAETWAETILDTWPQSEAVNARKLESVMFQHGGDFVLEHSHGSTTLYAERYITKSKVFSRGCNVRVFLGQSCWSGALGGVINAQNITDNTRNIISFGYTLPASPNGYVCIVGSRTAAFREMIKNGIPWGTAIVRYFSSALELLGRKGVVYGDLSLPSMMFPPDGKGPGRAAIPNPEDKERFVHPSKTILRWTSRFGTTSHDVFFGTDSTLDNTDFKGNRNETVFDPGDLAQGTTYYWRVDERNEHGITEGLVWRFSTALDDIPVKASQPFPPEDDMKVCLDAKLHWEAGDEAKSFDVYFEADDSSPDALVAGGSGDTMFDPGALAHNRTYFWRVDVKNCFGTTTTGDVWSFTTETKGPKRLFENLDTYGSTPDNRMYGVLFSIEKPIRITEISVDNLLIGTRNNVGIWREGKTTSPLHTFSFETGPTKRPVSQPVDIDLPKGTYRIAGLFKEYHFRTWLSKVDIACGIKNLKGVCEPSATRLQYPSDVSDSKVKGHVNFTFVPHGDDVVETVLSSKYDMSSPHLFYTKGSLLIESNIPNAAVIVVRMNDLRGRNVWEKTIDPIRDATCPAHASMIPLPTSAHGAYIVTVSSRTTTLRKRIMVVR